MAQIDVGLAPVADVEVPAGSGRSRTKVNGRKRHHAAIQARACFRL